MTRLYHISDIHFGAEDQAALDWFAVRVQRDPPDAVVCTGDLTQRARPREFEAAAAWLSALDPPVTVEVGNHDLPYFDVLQRLMAPYARYRAVETVIERPLDLMDVAIVPLKTTARAQWRLNWARGRVSNAALAETLAAIADVPTGRQAIVACHHPLVDAGTHTRAATRGGPDALVALAGAGVAAVLCGHTHETFDMLVPTVAGPIRQIGAGTLSRRVRGVAASFNELIIAKGSIQRRVHTMTVPRAVA